MRELEDLLSTPVIIGYALLGEDSQLPDTSVLLHVLAEQTDSGEPGKALQQRATGARSGKPSDWHAQECECPRDRLVPYKILTVTKEHPVQISLRTYVSI